ncbi:hypothetical protein [Niastella yeongjuensis]|uniref:hypothetical protein n=1 Tax=Niastella yeongjuensis TaxID=354355 RepID=UPI0008C69F67|nr:hypothetical protein [Niastella yeongjuensis]SEP42610.1 hypothetical protein SAMN05660816_06020 [Niastella yeongjuensis]
MKRRRLVNYLCAIISLLCCLKVHAQQITVTGKVTDQTNGNPLAGASVNIFLKKQQRF